MTALSESVLSKLSKSIRVLDGNLETEFGSRGGLILSGDRRSVCKGAVYLLECLFSSAVSRGWPKVDIEVICDFDSIDLNAYQREVLVAQLHLIRVESSNYMLIGQLPHKFNVPISSFEGSQDEARE